MSDPNNPDPSNCLNSHNLPFVEELYEAYHLNPESVSIEWQTFFRSLEGEKPEAVQPKPKNGRVHAPSFRPESLFHPHRHRPTSSRPFEQEHLSSRVFQHRIDQLIRNYRVHGHITADINPLGQSTSEPPELDPAYYGFTAGDWDRPFKAKAFGRTQQWTLREIIDRMRATYCRSIGVQFMHIDSLQVREWLQERMEESQNHLKLTLEQQVCILTRLTDAVTFEEFIQKKYIGAKSFSLEGAESLIPLLGLALEKAGAQGIEDVVFGMAHRGRLNVLANIMGKSPRLIFREFEDKQPELYLGRGDVKYHLGYHNVWQTSSGGEINLALCFNPSHLEYVNPVALGRLRAFMDRKNDHKHRRGMCILIHGDAAFAGEGIIQETLNLSLLRGYAVGGALHVIVNNQIGFTTRPQEGRSTVYASDVAKMLQSPIFHVNGEDPEAVAQVVNLALDFRSEFQRDVVIDMYCYRRRGHNEGDEPAFTDPLLYQTIRKRRSVRDNYLARLLELGEISKQEGDRISLESRERLEDELSVARSDTLIPAPVLWTGPWSHYRGGPESPEYEVPTHLDRHKLSHLLLQQTQIPKGFHPHPSLRRWLKAREDMALEDQPLDWAAGEYLAFASLAVQGHRVRVSGQDCERGTFSHRHAVLHDVETDQIYIPLQHLAPNQAPVEIYNSPLCESGVLGFEYGYSIAYPEALIIWEAQFGDFSNVAQPIIDQFISSAEDKWKQLSGLVLLLPHGFEGMGPEHSSARLERFLSIAAEENIQVAYPTTPAQIFHLLRRQVLRPWRTPLVVMSPKSLLRSPDAISNMSELAHGKFQKILADPIAAPEQTERIILCTGKIFYELHRERAQREIQEKVAILRVEQLYPLSDDEISEALSPYSAEIPVHWVQEEPFNMGAWPMFRNRFCESVLGRHPFRGIARPASASPATGSARSHQLEQQLIMQEAFQGIG
ncbi:MAG: 2-oxoglutarate dehydrogenase E1 component [Verrucomicrobiota bacterium]|jgi:2-oxoglutarate dehydrogenase E1 component|nr:2-oxoglutarate dehydrogenase E1 component [Verrucomicrobiota bacterium]MDI9384942.1 2-oxoglutarate dehydrogenase E1 component [Verrucomicrobiota bacterium]HCF96315.1 2-oxoglutarate dehydrogenase E1 component [Verrucomicrobiota bacterium]